MTLQAFDHVNVLTSNLDAMIAWYGDVLGLENGKRPSFGFPGAWMYLGDTAVVHLVAVDAAPTGYDGVRMEHVAFRAAGYTAFLDTLKSHDVEHSIAKVPGTSLVQVNIHDPDGNHLHIDFDMSSEPDA
ncbi:MAG: VOC family protein [Paracoccaceae bacterium]